MRVRENIRRKCPNEWCNNTWALYHDNAPAHASPVLRQFLASTKTTVISHPPYLPGLALCDFFLFPKMKLKLKGRRFDSIKEVQTESRDAIKMLTQNDF